ncbi:MAG: dUTP diphosphatase, partial [Actinomycetota bacterium]
LDPTETFNATAGSRIAQLVIQEFVGANFTEVHELPDSVRGDKGHGSTGVKN